VVVIDDDVSMRELISIHLRNAGYEVFAEPDAVEGGRAILKILPDLVVCDVEMPYMTGYELVEALKTHATTKNIPVVFLTVRDDVSEKAAKLGAAAYLRKPLTADRLLEVVTLYVG
jgi:DNA-binding response OmpR family regulator